MAILSSEMVTGAPVDDVEGVEAEGRTDSLTLLRCVFICGSTAVVLDCICSSDRKEWVVFCFAETFQIGRKVLKDDIGREPRRDRMGGTSRRQRMPPKRTDRRRLGCSPSFQMLCTSANCPMIYRPCRITA